MRNFALILVAVTAAGCAATGVKVDESKLADFKPGKTTYADVVHELGTPTTTTVTSNGDRMAMYTYGEAQVRPATLIPIVGAFAGGMDTRASSVLFMFDNNGILERYTSSQSQYGTGTGFTSGTSPSDSVPKQPRK